jgi:hypothetical protein
MVIGEFGWNRWWNNLNVCFFLRSRSQEIRLKLSNEWHQPENIIRCVVVLFVFYLFIQGIGLVLRNPQTRQFEQAFQKEFMCIYKESSLWMIIAMMTWPPGELVQWFSIGPTKRTESFQRMSKSHHHPVHLFSVTFHRQWITAFASIPQSTIWVHEFAFCKIVIANSF